MKNLFRQGDYDRRFADDSRFLHDESLSPGLKVDKNDPAAGGEGCAKRGYHPHGGRDQCALESKKVQFVFEERVFSQAAPLVEQLKTA